MKSFNKVVFFTGPNVNGENYFAWYISYLLPQNKLPQIIMFWNKVYFLQFSVVRKPKELLVGAFALVSVESWIVSHLPPPKSYIEVLTPCTLDCNWCGGKVLKDIIKLKWSI